jgi:hypothetical protein
MDITTSVTPTRGLSVKSTKATSKHAEIFRCAALKLDARLTHRSFMLSK